MKTLLPLYLISAIGYCCYPSSSSAECVTVDSVFKQPQKIETGDSTGFPDCLSSFKNVVDTLILSRLKHVHSEYFLYDITGDGTPDLWIKSGSCEADCRLMAYTLESGNPRKIYEGDGGHSDYFIYNGQLVSVMCNTGAGVVITYGYDGKQVTDSMVEFSTWNENGETLSEPHDSIADEKLKLWEDSYGNYIELKPL